MLDGAVAEFGRLDATVNNTGVTARTARIGESTREERDRVVSINLRGVWAGMQYKLRRQLRRPLLIHSPHLWYNRRIRKEIAVSAR